MRRILAVCAALLFCVAAVAHADLNAPARDGAAHGRGGKSPPPAAALPARDASCTPAPGLTALTAPGTTAPNSLSLPVSGASSASPTSVPVLPASGLNPTDTPVPSTSAQSPTASQPGPPPSPAAAMSLPCVDAQWYADRNEQLRMLLERNGSFQSRGEIDAAIEKMHIDPAKPMVALTFDDGPAAGVTDAILDILEEYNVRATFFIVGCRLKKPEAVQTVRRAISLGCEIGNHTWAHENLAQQNSRQKYDAIKKTSRIVFDNTGYVMRSLRPPGGYYDREVSYLAKRNGMAIVKWAQSGDVYEQEPEKIAQNVQKQLVNGRELYAGDIILLHDTHPRMVEAVRIIIPRLLEEGYQLVTAWELINCSEDGFTAGKTYHHQ